MRKSELLYSSLFILLLVFSFSGIIVNLGTHLPDWYDYPYVVWIIYQNVEKFRLLQLDRLFQTNILYPNPNTLLLTETLFAQSLMALPIRIFTNNPILIFNIIFFLTFILNYLSSFLLWKLLFKKRVLAFVGAILVVFSPYFHAQLGHFQTQTYWPYLLSLYFLFLYERDYKKTYLFLCGLFIAVQFYASVYISVFLVTTIGIYYLVKVILYKDIVTNVRSIIVIGITSFILALPVIQGYFEVNRYYGIERGYSEYITYSAHLSDYVFSNGYRSLLHNISLIQRWNKFNHHTLGEAALFPGFLLSIFAFLALFKIKPLTNSVSVFSKFSVNDIFFLFISISGFIFSLGPRINFNGVYGHIPLPYDIILKIVPFVDIVRTPARWAFLFYLGLVYFTLKYLKTKKKGRLFIVSVFFIALIEYFPFQINTHPEQYIEQSDVILKQLCEEKKQVVLEIPVTHFDVKGGIASGVSYISKTTLSTTYHNCYIINGYSSYDLPEIQKLKNDLYTAIADENSINFYQALKNANPDFITINDEHILEEVKPKIRTIINTLEQESLLNHVSASVYRLK